MLNVVVLNGGRGAASIIRSFIRNNVVKLTSVVNAYDDGKSTGEIRHFFDMLGPSDIRKAQELLLPEDSPHHELKKHLFGHRYPAGCDQKRVRAEIRDFAEGRSDAIGGVTLEEPLLKELVRSALKKFMSALELAEVVKGRNFDFDDCSLMNCIYAGMYLLCDRELEKASRAIEKAFGLVGTVLPTSIDNKKLCGIREDGTVLSCEADIVELRSNTRIERIFLVSEWFEAQHLSKLDAEEKRSYLESLNCHVDATKSVRDAIMAADIIVYGPGTQHSSLYPTYMTRGIASSIAENRTALKVFVTNIGADYETPSYKASDYIRGAYYYLSIGADRAIAMPELFDVNLVNRVPARPEERKSYVDFDKVGFLHMDVPIELDDYECRERTGRHDGDKIVEKSMILHSRKLTRLLEAGHAARH
jgi:2-phospho-L-lactate transferase/gluconeogenesis factor (CofD/UPF0052 family)